MGMNSAPVKLTNWFYFMLLIAQENHNPQRLPRDLDRYEGGTTLQEGYENTKFGYAYHRIVTRFWRQFRVRRRNLLEQGLRAAFVRDLFCR